MLLGHFEYIDIMVKDYNSGFNYGIFAIIRLEIKSFRNWLTCIKEV